MIYDAIVRVTCDRDGCREHTEIEPNYVYSTYSGGGGHYDTEDSAIEKKLEQEGWVVEGDKQYCSTECAHPADSEEPEEAP